MQQLAQDEAGNVWEVDAQGNAIRLHQAAGGASGGQVFSLPQDPMAIAKDQAQLQSAQAQAARAAAEAPYVAQTAQAQAMKAQADATKAQRDLDASLSTANPDQQKRMSALANDEILGAIDAARGNLGRFGATGFGARLPELMQTQGAVDLSSSLNTIASRLTLDKLAQLKQASPTGASGLGSLTEKEGALLRDSVAALGQTQSHEQLSANLAAVEKHYRNYMALTKGEDYRDPKVAQRYGIVPEPQQDQMGLSRNGYREESDPALKGVNTRIRGMVGAGASASDIVAYMNSVQPGLGDKRAGDVSQVVKFRAQNPKVPLDRYTISVENRSVPLSATRNFINDVAQTPFGAGMIAAGDVASMGTLDNLQENPALARAGMRQIASENPTANVVGTLAGGIATGGGFEAMAGRAGAAWAPRIADVAFGALSGAGNADDGSRLEGAGWGALSGIAGGEAGRRGLGMFGRGVRGVQNEAAQTLRARGIPLTIGQIRGGAARALEDRLAGFSGVGDRIMSQRRAGMQAFNRAAFDEGLQPIGQSTLGQVGEDGVDIARQAVSGSNGAYDRALRGVVLTPDPQFATDMGAALAAGRGVARTGPEFQSFVDNRIAPVFDANPSGQITGRQMQDVVQGLRGADFGTDAMGQLARDATVRMEGAVTDLAGRQAPGAMEAFGNANTAYRNLNILSDAVGRGINTGGLFTPAQLGTAARQNTNRFGGRIAAATPDRPFYELQRAGQDVLPSQIPDSGTAGRADAGAEGITAMMRRGFRNAKGAVVYNELLQEPITRALLDRTPGMVAAGGAIERRARLGGLFGRPLALSYGPLAVVPDY